MNETNSGYFATMFALEAEAKSFFGECRYKKAVESVMRAEGACEMIEAFFAPKFANEGAGVAAPGSWSEFKKAYEEHLSRIGVLDDNGSLIDLFAVIGVAKPLGGWSEAFVKEVEAAYRPKAQKLHPDKNPGNTRCEEEFKKLGRAKEVLREKDAYDFYVVAHVLFFGN